MKVYVIGAILGTVAALWFTWQLQSESTRAADTMRFMDMLALLMKHLPACALGALVGLGIVHIL